jgi:V/A-type H+/Na+-transporting ATPase subunit D
MAARQPKTRLELKRQREALARFERFLGALKRKQQKLQMALEEVRGERARAVDLLERVQAEIAGYEALLEEEAGIALEALARPAEVRTATANVAGIAVPSFVGVDFPRAGYSLFATAAWVDRALTDLRRRAAAEAELHVLEQRRRLLSRELVRIVQRVNLFEKVMIPGAEVAIRRIRIHLGDEMAAAVGRAKLAKAKLAGGAAAGEAP